MMNPQIDLFLTKVDQWHEELVLLREILLECRLTEELKWKVPCYTYEGNNIVILHGFKAFCALGFFKGILLEDNDKLLSMPGENTQSSRTMKFTSVKQITEMKSTIIAYIYEAIEIEKAGLKIVPKDISELVLVEELQQKLNENPLLKSAFDALTPGRKRGYNLYFSDAKQAKSRISRIEKYEQKILSGKGINDCTCGMSKRMPACDGSHKYL